jgi:hypothetical protein
MPDRPQKIPDQFCDAATWVGVGTVVRCSNPATYSGKFVSEPGREVDVYVCTRHRNLAIKSANRIRVKGKRFDEYWPYTVYGLYIENRVRAGGISDPNQVRGRSGTDDGGPEQPDRPGAQADR